MALSNPRTPRPPEHCVKDHEMDYSILRGGGFSNGIRKQLRPRTRIDVKNVIIKHVLLN